MSGHRCAHLDELTKGRIVELAATATIAAIACRLALHPDTVRRQLREAGVLALGQKPARRYLGRKAAS